jgi:two-component system phosphate regulon sensor histidine kinase PhoR
LAQRKYLWRLFYPYLVLILVALLAFGLYSAKVFEDFYISKTEESLKYRAFLINEELKTVPLDSIIINHILDRYDKLTDTRVTLIDTNGIVLADSRQDPRTMELHNDRPEIMEAYKGNMGFSMRYSHTLQTDLMYIAVPYFDHSNKIRAVLRASVVVEKVYLPFSSVYTTIVFGGIIVLILVTFIGFFISRNKAKPILEMRSAAERFASGNFKEKIFPPKNPELRSLSDSLNEMAGQLDDKLNIIEEQKKLQNSVFESMKEGVLAVDYDEKILLINKTAQNILSVASFDNIGKTLQEVVRISDIHKFFKKVLNEENIQDTEVLLQHEEDKILQLSGTLLRDFENIKIGALVVINDISNLKHLDNLKRDLVANVSHELKTPITSIKGFIETLQEGAVDDPEKTKRFLEIISKQTDRLIAIIDDLLSLSRLEQKADSKDIIFEENLIKPLINSAIEDYEYKAKEKNISFKVQCESSLKAKVNRLLIEQAIGNLIDNAIKYSDENKEIKISSFLENKSLIMNVSDEGFGIAAEHLPRLFERFYRVDKSRSRDEGGTGLGLSIIKHIVQVHNGTVDVESSPGKGSKFSIKIPFQM